MSWRNRDLWKAAIVVGSVLFLVLMTLLTVSVADAHGGVLGAAIAGTVTVQVTPTVDPTMVALQKEQLEQEIQQLKDQNNPDLLSWLRANAATLLSTLIVVGGGLIGLFRWFGDRRDEQEKRVEERFQKVVESLGGKDQGAKAGAAILLRTFLQKDKGYEKFHQQVFDLAVTHLRLRSSTNPHSPKPPDSLSQALAVVFKEAVPRVREGLEKDKVSLEEYSKVLDASRVNLDGASLDGIDLSYVYLREASFVNAHLDNANLTKAQLMGADFTGADLYGVNFTGAYMWRTHPEDASAVEAAIFNGVEGLTKVQLTLCQANGAIVDEATMAAAPQTIAPSAAPAPSSTAQAPAVPPAPPSQLSP